MKNNIIRVKSYSGYKAEERPISFSVGDKEFKIKEILDTSLEEKWGKRFRGFRVRTEDNGVFKICYHEEERLWYLEG